MAAKQVKKIAMVSAMIVTRRLYSSEKIKKHSNIVFPSLNVDSSIPEVKVSLCVNENLIKENSYIIFLLVLISYTSLDMLKPSKVVDNDGWMDDPRGIGCSMDGKWAVADKTNGCVYLYDSEDQLVIGMVISFVVQLE